MLTLIVGEKEKRASTAQKIINSEIKAGKKLVSFSDSSFHAESVLSYLSVVDMFGSKYFVQLANILDNHAGLEFFLNNAEVLQKSGTHFLVEENEITAELKEVMEKVGAEIIEYKKEKENYFGKLTPFALVDVYNQRDKKNSWITFTKLIEAGISAEEITGALIWNFKNLALYFSTYKKLGKKPSAEDLGLKPFVFGKVSSAVKNFSEKEISENAFKLSSALHSSHRGEGEGAVLLELFILKTL